MILDVWPGTLPQNYIAADYTDTLADALIKDEYNVGPPSYRRRTTAAVRRFSGTMVMNAAEWIILRSFFQTTLLDGTLRFTFPPQGVSDRSRFWISRFVSPPRRQLSNSDDAWFVSLEMEILGSGESILTTGLMTDGDAIYTPIVSIDQQMTVARHNNTNTFPLAAIGIPYNLVISFASVEAQS